MDILLMLSGSLWSTVLDVAPILTILVLFQVVVLRQPPANLPRMLLGFVYVVLGLNLFLVGLDLALFPLGNLMASQLTDTAFIGGEQAIGQWQSYIWVYVFAALIGFSTTIAEPALIAVAMKVEEASGGSIRGWGLRLAVAVGAATGVALGTVRIVTGVPLPWFILAGYVIVIVQTMFAPKAIIPLAYDSGGVTTSTVTVPLVAALGLGLATSIPGRSPLMDGFGMVALTCLFPIVSVMGYAQVGAILARRRSAAPPDRPQDAAAGPLRESSSP